MSFEAVKNENKKGMTVNIDMTSWSYPKMGGIYNGVVVDVSTFQGQYGTALRIVYEINDGKQKYRIPDYIPYHETITPNSKLFKRVVNILGIDANSTKSVNIEDIIDKPVKITVIPVIKNGKTYMQVSEVEGAF